MDGGFAVEPQRANPLRLGSDRGQVAELPGRHVDGRHAGQSRTVNHSRTGVQQPIPRGLGTQLQGQVETPKNDTHDRFRGRSDGGDVLQSLGRLDQRDQSQRGR